MDHPKRDDGAIAIAILVGTLVVALFVAINVLRKRNTSTSFKQISFSPPIERDAFLRAKDQLNTGKSSEADELKKLLMKRAIKTIPILLQLQNEGTSIDRLYKKGMLTDDMHFKMKEIKGFVDQEFQDIKLEADELLEGWGEQIWQQAMQYHQTLQKQIDGVKQVNESPLGADETNRDEETHDDNGVGKEEPRDSKVDSGEEKKKAQKKKGKK